jgi:hypothetical protein
METERISWLRKIENGEIFDYLTEYLELEKMDLNDNTKKVLYRIIDLNKEGRFPRRKNLLILTRNNYIYLHNYIKCLKGKNLIVDVTIPELLNVFGIWYSPGHFKLPKQLDYATYYDRLASKIRGATLSWKNKMRNPRATHFSRYHIALVSENHIPVFVKAFSFLDRYNLLVAPQTGQTQNSFE